MIRYDLKANYHRKEENKRRIEGLSQAGDNEGDKGTSKRMSYVRGSLTLTVGGIFWKK